jgi:hypothetical protein
MEKLNKGITNLIVIAQYGDNDITLNDTATIMILFIRRLSRSTHALIIDSDDGRRFRSKCVADVDNQHDSRRDLHQGIPITGPIALTIDIMRSLSQS